mmetsp:Transcript_24895/g.45114  ORF Transcript_24895/g.45114 Transcript_24895/m.45114 type:complete len:107 (-) Transcript_24895:118-438(-)
MDDPSSAEAGPSGPRREALAVAGLDSPEKSLLNKEAATPGRDTCSTAWLDSSSPSTALVTAGDEFINRMDLQADDVLEEAAENLHMASSPAMDATSCTSAGFRQKP